MMFAVVSLALLMSSLDQTIVATALNDLQDELHTSVAWAGWTITAYSFGLVLMLSLSGKLSDRYGRRRVFFASAAIFTAASLCCGLADNIHVLIALRVVQAIGGAGFTPSATGIVVENFGAGRDKAVGLFGSIFSIGAMIGPIAGGVLVEYWSWRGVFFVNVPIGIILLLLGLRYIPVDRPRPENRHIGLDLAGVAMLGTGLLALMLAITYLGSAHARVWDWPFVVPIALAALALPAFLRHVGRHSDPFIAPRLIYGRGFGAVNVITVLYNGAVLGMVALIPLYAITRYQLSALSSATLLTVEGAAVIVLSVLAAMLLRRTGYRRPIYLGALLVVVGMFALALGPRAMSPYVWLSVAAGVIGVGVGWAAPATRNACLQLVPEQSAGLAALRSTGLQLGSIGAVAVATAIITQAADHAAAQAAVFAVFALILLAALPVVSRVPEHFGTW